MANRLKLLLLILRAYLQPDLRPPLTMKTVSVSFSMRHGFLLFTILAIFSLSGCGDSFPSQKKGEALSSSYLKAYFKGDFNKVVNLLPHEERVTRNLELHERFMNRNIEKAEKLGGVKNIEAKETRILVRTERGPTKISVRYSLDFKNSDSKGSVRLEARMIEGKWYVTSNNFFPSIPNS